MLPDEMEAEKNRKMILAQADEIDILKNNIKELQEQLNVAHKRIASVSEDWGDMRDKLDAAQIHNKNLTQSLANAYGESIMQEEIEVLTKLLETDLDEEARKNILELLEDTNANQRDN